MLLDLDGERIRRKKNVLMILMYLNNITNDFVQNCLKVTHVNSLSGITVKSSMWSSTKIRGNKIWWKKEKKLNFALSLINNAVLNTPVIMSLMSFMFSILPFWNIFPLEYSVLQFFLKKHAEYDSTLPSKEKVNYFLCLDACDRTVFSHSPLPH